MLTKVTCYSTVYHVFETEGKSGGLVRKKTLHLYTFTCTQVKPNEVEPDVVSHHILEFKLKEI